MTSKDSKTPASRLKKAKSNSMRNSTITNRPSLSLSEEQLCKFFVGLPLTPEIKSLKLANGEALYLVLKNSAGHILSFPISTLLISYGSGPIETSRFLYSVELKRSSTTGEPTADTNLSRHES